MGLSGVEWGGGRVGRRLRGVTWGYVGLRGVEWGGVGWR